jgi:hypothetical protein
MISLPTLARSARGLHDLQRVSAQEISSWTWRTTSCASYAPKSTAAILAPGISFGRTLIQAVKVVMSYIARSACRRDGDHGRHDVYRVSYAALSKRARDREVRHD